MGCLLPYLCMVTVPHIMVRLERMLDYRSVVLERFHCIHTVPCVYICMYVYVLCIYVNIVLCIIRLSVLHNLVS